MCGIAGAVGTIDRSIVEAVKLASDSMTHRGPDGSGVWEKITNNRGVVLAHRRLAIIDLNERSNQPMLDPNTGCVLTYNGEIYNFRSLRNQLQELGHIFKTSGDTEVVLKAYSEWGKDCVRQFEGMFAFAIYDPKKDQTFIARDHSGIKPLYYSIAKQPNNFSTFLFASELRALLATGLVNRQLSPEGLSTYLWNGFCVEPNTLIKGVYLLEAGHTLTLESSGEFNIFNFRENPGENNSGHIDQNDFSRELESIVKHHLISDVPVGVFLSGGVDSSLVATLAAKASSDPINTFNISFSETEHSEAQYAKRISESIGSNHHEFLLSDTFFKANLNNALRSLDQPTFDGINTYFVSKLVADEGIKVALSGAGGDELFGGYSSFREIPLIEKWAKALNIFPPSARAYVANLLVRSIQGYQSLPPQSRWGKLADLISTEIGIINSYQVSYSLFTQEFLECLSPNYSGKTTLGLPHEMLSSIERELAGKSLFQKISAIEEKMFLGQRLLRDTDSCSMNVSLEVRVPLVGRKITELANRLPDSLRFLPMGKKAVLRNIVEHDLPPGIFDRPKKGFELPIGNWLKNSLNENGRELFYNKQLTTRVGLDSDSVQKLWNAFHSGEKGIYWSRIWSLYVLFWWCSEHEVSV